jgi:cobalt-zinc-cadmium efflux system outer membrane protein
MDYLHERQHKRELRLESAQQGTGIAETQQLDLERTMLFTLRSAFVQTLQAKQLLLQAQANLDYYNKELAIFRSRLQSGGIARVDLDRMVLQRVQYESDYQGALTNARTAKITLRMMLNEQTPVDRSTSRAHLSLRTGRIGRKGDESRGDRDLEFGKWGRLGSHAAGLLSATAF